MFVAQTRQRAVRQQNLERVAGIEPAYSAWKAAALPLSYTRAFSVKHRIRPKTTALFDPMPLRFKASGLAVVERVGFEPT